MLTQLNGFLNRLDTNLRLPKKPILMTRAATGNLDNVCGGLIHGVLVSTSFQTLMPSLAGTRRKEAFNQLVMFFPQVCAF